MLREHCRPQTLLPDDLAAVGFHGGLEEAQERGLAGAVAAQEADPFARLDRQIGTLQDRGAAKAQGHVR